jgi:hypothetical protein
MHQPSQHQQGKGKGGGKGGGKAGGGEPAKYQSEYAKTQERVIQLKNDEIEKRDKLIKELRAGAKENTPPFDEEEAEEGAAEVFDFSIEQLLDQKKMVRQQGKAESHPKVLELSEQIKKQQRVKTENLPQHVQMQRAERWLKARQKYYDGAKCKVEEITDQLQEAEKQKKDFNTALQAAEMERSRLIASFGETKPAMPAEWAGLGDKTDEDFKSLLGCTKKEAMDFMGKLATFMGTQGRAVKSATAGSQEEQAEGANKDADMGVATASIPGCGSGRGREREAGAEPGAGGRGSSVSRSPRRKVEEDDVERLTREYDSSVTAGNESAAKERLATLELARVAKEAAATAKAAIAATRKK